MKGELDSLLALQTHRVKSLSRKNPMCRATTRWVNPPCLFFSDGVNVFFIPKARGVNVRKEEVLSFDVDKCGKWSVGEGEGGNGV